MRCKVSVYQPFQAFWRGSFPKMIRRLVVGMVLPFFLIQAIFVPIYLGLALDQTMTLLVKRAALNKTFFTADHNFTEQEKLDLYNYHRLRGVVYSTSASAKKNYLWFVEDNKNLKNVRIINMDKRNFLHSYWDVVYFLRPHEMDNIIIKKTLPETGEVIHAVMDESIVAVRLKDSILRIMTATILFALFSIFSLRFVLGREFVDSLRQLVTLSGLDGVNTGKGGMAERLATHIREQARLASIGTGATRLAHDLRNMLASLQLYAERLSASDSERDRKMGSLMIDSIEKAVTLCDWTKHYSSTTRKNLDRRVQQVSSLVEEALTLVQLHDAKKKVQLVNQCNPRHFIDCERTLIFRIVYNVVLNAIQAIHASGQAGRVVIRSLPSGAGTFVQIEDNGPGMDEETVKKLFIPYQGSLKPGGTGLGMAIAEELARWHGGSLELLHTGAGGSCFQLFVPDSLPDSTNPARNDVQGEAA